MLKHPLIHGFVMISLLASIVLAFTPQVARAECNVYHQVVRGQNLFRISLRYGVSMQAIAAANGIADVSRIYAGQTLYIPCVGNAAPVAPPPAAPSNIYYPYYNTYSYTPPFFGSPIPADPYAQLQPPITQGGLDCTGFRATSPGAFPNGTAEFYWDPPRSGDQIARYQVRVLDENGRQVATFETFSPQTSVRGDVSRAAIGPEQGIGVKYSWYVVGVTADNRLCQTQTVPVQREWANP